MQRAKPYCGENSEADRNMTESLTSNPELENGLDPNGAWAIIRVRTKAQEALSLLLVRGHI